MPATRTAALQLPPLLVGVAAGVALFGGYHESNLPYLLLLLGCAYLAWERFRREDELAATTGSAAAPQKPKTPALWTASPWTPTPPSPTPSTMPAALTTVSFTVNGASRVVDAGAAATTDLVSYLRYNELLTGTKISCHEGGCGACTVLLLRPGESEAVPVNACLRKLASCDGCAITTVEGLGTMVRPASEDGDTHTHTHTRTRARARARARPHAHAHIIHTHTRRHTRTRTRTHHRPQPLAPAHAPNAPADEPPCVLRRRAGEP
jgi:hypothetical protein